MMQDWGCFFFFFGGVFLDKLKTWGGVEVVLKSYLICCCNGTVDGSEIRLYNQLRLVVYPIIYRVLAPSQDFLPSTVIVRKPQEGRVDRGWMVDLVIEDATGTLPWN